MPYALSSFSRDLKQGSRRVKIGGQPVALHGKSYYVSKPLGNEAATRSFGASMVNHQLAGKTKYAAGSTDVRFEGAKVCRHLDMTTSNHGSDPGEGASPATENMGPPERPAKLEKCPCCKNALHANQFDPDTGEPYEVIDEQEWYKVAVDYHVQKDRGVAAFLAKNPSWLQGFDSKQGIPNAQKIEISKAKLARAQHEYNMLAKAQTENPKCENLTNAAEDQGCRTYFKKTNPEPRTSEKRVREKLGFTEKVRQKCIDHYRYVLKRQCTGSSPVCHKTPLAAGGCPSHQPNLVPKQVLSEHCAGIDDAQTSLQGLAADLHAS
ncbi:hypothetical protein DB30_06612 [Enhygromyxa salina]|uniref:Uncharacterized protein n=1 Tax=Enhygromyxa salina TaxID=215803 RepID=A0A0C2D747_9BACT|nr:hypothetical protein DB30_06612 [Enhygromyxa salina]